MKMPTISFAIAIAIAGVAGTAVAGNQATLPPLQVSASEVWSCEPPADAPNCGNFHRWLLANFSEREIGMLFGTPSSYPEYLSGGLKTLHRRYERKVLHEYLAARNASSKPIAAR